jgi:hypothetical protein
MTDQADRHIPDPVARAMRDPVALAMMVREVLAMLDPEDRYIGGRGGLHTMALEDLHTLGQVVRATPALEDHVTQAPAGLVVNAHLYAGDAESTCRQRSQH